MDAEIVFVPGFMQRADAWADVAARVGERYRSVCLDHRAGTAAGRIAEIMAACHPETVLVGYSLGGRLGLHAVLRGARPRLLVTVGASAGIEDARERERRRQADEELAAWIESHPIEQVVDRWAAQPVFASQPPELVARQRAGRLAHDPGALATLLRTAGQGVMPPVWDRLATLPVPLLAIAGERDERYADAARRIAAIVPDGRFALVPGSGHAPQLEDPEAVAALLLGM